MRAVVFHGVGDIRLETVPDPELQEPTDAIIRITASAICGTDLHMVRGTMPGMEPGRILGHEAVGEIVELGSGVRNLSVGDRVVVPSTISCGSCSYCRRGFTAQCDRANPNGPQAGTAFFGGPQAAGGFDGLQAEFARIPHAHSTLVKLPDAVDDDRAILLSDIFPTGWFGADMADIAPGRTVAVFGCGPVGQFAILSAKLMGAGRVFAIDDVPSRLDMAKEQGAEVIHFEEDHPVETLRELTGGIGVDRVIDAVGVDATTPQRGPAAEESRRRRSEFARQFESLPARDQHDGDRWHPGDGPSQVLDWAVHAAAKAGKISIIGVYPAPMRAFPIGEAMFRNLSIRMGNCNHRRYIPELVERVRGGAVDPLRVLTQIRPMADAIQAYETFAGCKAGWMKVELNPARS